MSIDLLTTEFGFINVKKLLLKEFLLLNMLLLQVNNGLYKISILLKMLSCLSRLENEHYSSCKN